MRKIYKAQGGFAVPIGGVPVPIVVPMNPNGVLQAPPIDLDRIKYSIQNGITVGKIKLSNLISDISNWMSPKRHISDKVINPRDLVRALTIAASDATSVNNPYIILDEVLTPTIGNTVVESKKSRNRGRTFREATKTSPAPDVNAELEQAEKAKAQAEAETKAEAEARAREIAKLAGEIAKDNESVLEEGTEEAVKKNKLKTEEKAEEVEETLENPEEDNSNDSEEPEGEKKGRIKRIIDKMKNWKKSSNNSLASEKTPKSGKGWGKKLTKVAIASLVIAPILDTAKNARALERAEKEGREYEPNYKLTKYGSPLGLGTTLITEGIPAVWNGTVNVLSDMSLGDKKEKQNSTVEAPTQNTKLENDSTKALSEWAKRILGLVNGNQN